MREAGLLEGVSSRGVRRTHKYCLLHKSRKPRNPLHEVFTGDPTRRLRAWWDRLVKLGGVICRRCGEEILPHEPWDLDHDPDGGPRAYLGPSHARCNRATNDGRRVSRIW